MKKQIFKEVIEKKFSYLKSDYKFVLLGIEDEPDFYMLVFKNQTTGVKITYDYRDAKIFVYLYKLKNGEIVEDKTPISKEIPLNSIELGYIEQYRNAEKLTKALYDTSAKTFGDYVSNIADNLKLYADDVLKGDFGVFSELDLIAKKRRLEWQESSF